MNANGVMHAKLTCSFSGFLLFALMSVNAHATSACYQWRYAHADFDSGWLHSKEAVFAAMHGCDKGQCGIASITWCTNVVVTGHTVSSTTQAFPDDSRVHLQYQMTCTNPTYPTDPPQVVNQQTDSQQPSSRTNPSGCEVYASAVPRSERGRTCNGVGDPIDPASCRVYATEIDVAGPGNALAFKRFYNSTDTSGSTSSAGWRYSFSRSVTPQYSSSAHQPYAMNPDNSSLYTTEAAACTSGFAEIKSRVSTWASATASYGNGVCTLSVGGTSIGRLPLFYSSPPTPAPGTAVLIGVDGTRDDGEVVSFMVNGGSLVPPPSIKLKLQQTSSGYALTDADDAVEVYDTDGSLLSVTSRAGVVQTMGYDSSGRLSTVTDTFGHSLMLKYDSQGRLSAVSRQ